MNLHDFVPWMEIATFITLLWIIYQSRKWTGPAMYAQVRDMESDVHIVRANVRRLEDEFLDWKKEVVQTNDQILREISAIRGNMRDKNCTDAVEELTNRIVDLEQVISSVPCNANKETRRG